MSATAPAAASRAAREKVAAGEAAAALVENGMTVGLGTGSTAKEFVAALGRRALNIRCVATSMATAAQAESLGLAIIPLDAAGRIDLTVDGADEIGPGLALIKGGGGALLREKLVWEASARCVVIADSGKRVARLGAYPLPVEVTPFGYETTGRRIMAAVAKIAVLLVALGGVAAVGISAFAPEIIANITEVYTGTLNKQESSSYQDRTSADIDSLEATLGTYGLGTGWGSNRSSSLIPGLLASVGVPGMAGLIWFGVGLTRAVKRARRAGGPPDQVMVIDGCCGAVVGFLTAAVISGPTISSVAFFFLLAVLIGSVARIEAGVAARRSSVGRMHASARASQAAARPTINAQHARDTLIAAAGSTRR